MRGRAGGTSSQSAPGSSQASAPGKGQLKDLISKLLGAAAGRDGAAGGVPVNASAWKLPAGVGVQEQEQAQEQVPEEQQWKGDPGQAQGDEGCPDPAPEVQPGDMPTNPDEQGATGPEEDAAGTYTDGVPSTHLQQQQQQQQQHGVSVSPQGGGSPTQGSGDLAAMQHLQPHAALLAALAPLQQAQQFAAFGGMGGMGMDEYEGQYDASMLQEPGAEGMPGSLKASDSELMLSGNAAEEAVRVKMMVTIRKQLASLGYEMNESHWAVKVGKEGGRHRVHTLYWHEQPFKSLPPAMRAFKLVMACITRLASSPPPLPEHVYSDLPRPPIPVAVHRSGKHLYPALWINAHEVFADCKVQPSFLLCDPDTHEPLQSAQPLSCTALVARSGLSAKGGRRDVQLLEPLTWQYGLTFEPGSTLAWVLSTVYAAQQQVEISLPTHVHRPTLASVANPTQRLVPCNQPVMQAPEAAALVATRSLSYGAQPLLAGPQPSADEPPSKRLRRSSSRSGAAATVAAAVAAVRAASRSNAMDTTEDEEEEEEPAGFEGQQHDMPAHGGELSPTDQQACDESEAAAAGLLLLVQPSGNAAEGAMQPPLPPSQLQLQLQPPMHLAVRPPGLPTSGDASASSAPHTMALTVPASLAAVASLPEPQYVGDGWLTPLCELRAMDGMVRLMRSLGCTPPHVRQLWQRYNGQYSTSDEGRALFARHYLQLYHGADDPDYVKQVLCEQFGLQL